MERYENSPFVRRPAQERSRAALARIIEAASDLLVREGVSGFSIAEIAKAADIPAGNIYRRFEGKDSIVRAIMLDLSGRLEDIVRERLQGRNFANAYEVVAELAAGMKTMSVRHEALLRVMYNYPITSSDQTAMELAARRRLSAYYEAEVSGFLQYLPEQRRRIVIGVSYQIVASAFASKSRGQDPILNEISWQALAQEVARAANGYLREAT